MDELGKLILLRLSSLLIIAAAAVAATPLETAFCNKFVRSQGYLCAEYQVMTLDGYVLNLQNVGPSVGPGWPPPPPVYLQSVPEVTLGGDATVRTSNTTTNTTAFTGNGTAIPTPEPTNNTSARPAARTPPSPPPPSPPPPPLSVTRPSVLFDHAIFLGGEIWLDGLPPATRLPFILVERGFDVWIGHHRATEFSPDSIYYPRETFTFWDFSFDELAKYDLPEMLALIQRVTGKRKIHFVGYNQGAMLPLALASESASFADSLASAVLVGPTAFVGNITSPVLNSWGNGFTPDTFFYQAGLLNGEYNLSNTVNLENLLDLLGYDLVDAYGGGDPNSLVNNITGPNCCVSESTITTFNSQINMNWVVASYRNLIHFQQEIRSTKFQYWDFLNETQNLAYYGTPTPPSYALGNIPPSLPIYLITGAQDWFSDTHNIQQLVDALSAKPKMLTLPTYAHFDLIFSDSIVEDIYESVVDYLEGGYLEK